MRVVGREDQPIPADPIHDVQQVPGLSGSSIGWVVTGFIRRVCADGRRLRQRRTMKLPHQMRPGNRYARETGAGRTLGQMACAKMALVAVCQRCKHRRVLYPANLIPTYGENFPTIELRKLLRCTGCRGRMANLHESSR
jgi:hypothetical protein